MLRVLPLERIRTDPLVVFRRPSKHKMQFACLPYVVAVLLMFALRIRVFFLNGITDRDALHKERQLQVWTNGRFAQWRSQRVRSCSVVRLNNCWAHARDLVKKIINTCGGCGRGILCRQQVVDPETTRRRFDRFV